MAKHIITEQYTFNPTTKTITIVGRVFLQEEILLITNVTKNTVIYNFSDPSLGMASFSVQTPTVVGMVPTTTIVLNYNTSSHSATDKLSIMFDEYETAITPSEALTDPVNKMRVSMPQSMIDTDFEYGTQPTKWESISLINNRPFAFYNVQSPITITGVNATNNSRTVTVLTASPPTVGTPIFIQDCVWGAADGLYIVDSVSAGVSFSYTAKMRYTGTTGSIYNSAATICYSGTVFTGANIPVTSYSYTGNIISVTTTGPHGLGVGNEIALTGTTASTNAPNGSWTVAGVTSPTVFTFYSSVGTPTGTVSGGTLYVRPAGLVYHRPFDGGVQFSTLAQSHNQQLIRQTRRYFRYQSGKGIQMSTGTILRPNINIDQMTASGTTITVITRVPHQINPGTVVLIAGAIESGYNGSFTVTQVIDPYTFKFTAAVAPTVATASGSYYLSVSNWYGATTRIGMFDSQNGIFFEFDGQTLYAVRRNSTYQVSGVVSITAGSSTVTGGTVNGVSTLFSKQLVPGDWIVIRGMSYKVESIASDTSMTIQPGYRGASNLTNGIVSKTVDLRIPQSQWNMDKMDGTGQSGTLLDIHRMQMFYMDYSWYGAGFIRWGFRGANGNVQYCHKIVNNNVNYEAYMRSGNLPARYETNTFSKLSTLTASMSSGATTISINNTEGWPSAGTIFVRNSTQAEYINFTGKTQTASLVGTTTVGSATVLMTNTTNVAVGQAVSSPNTQWGAVVTAVTTNVSVTLSLPATFTGSTTISFDPQLTGLTRAQAGGALTFTTVVGNPVVTGASTSGVQIGQFVVGTGIPDNAYVVSFVNNTSVLLSEAATAAGSVSLTFLPMASTAQTFTYSLTAPVSIELHSPQFAPQISHWGTSVIMDGRYDDDKSFVFTTGTTTAISVAAAATNAVMSLRIGPTVSNGLISSNLGDREIVNRMQLILRQLDLFSNGQFLITVVLNGTVSSATPTWTNVGGSSLAQYVNHNAGTTITGGEVIYGFYLNSAGGTNYTTTSVDLALIRDLGTSILSGGGTAPNANFYPNGPDMITIMCRNIGSAAANTFARMSWTEAQA
jgi:hypothetical protein